MSAMPTVWVGGTPSTCNHRLAFSSHGWGACSSCCCIASFTCCRETVLSIDIPPSAAAILSRAWCIRAPGSPTCRMSGTSKGVRVAGRASSTAPGSSPSDGRRAMGPMSLLRTTAAPHRLSNVDRRLSGLGTRRRVPMADMRAHTPQSLLLSGGCCTCAA